MATKGPDERMQEIKEAFHMFDPGNSGHIETKDLGTAVRSLGQNPSEADVKEMIKEADRRDKGFIVYEDFMKTVSSHWKEVTPEEDIIECFKVFDREGSGYLEAKELKKVLLNLGEQMSAEEVEDMLKVANLDQDGQLNYRPNSEVSDGILPKFKPIQAFMADLVTCKNEEDPLENVFDREGSGYLEAKELKKVLLNLGEQMSAEEVEDMLKVANLDQDGQLNYRQLTQLLLSSAK